MRGRRRTLPRRRPRPARGTGFSSSRAESSRSPPRLRPRLRGTRRGRRVRVAAMMSDWSLGPAATVHLACAVDNIDWGVSLTHFYLAEDLVRVPLPMRNGLVALPTKPGVGVEVDEAAVARMRVD